MGRDTRGTRVLLAALLAAAFTLITIDYRSGQSVDGIRGAIHSVFAPVEDGVAIVVRPIGRTASSLTHPNRYRDRANALAKENAALKRQIATNAALTRDAAELSSLRLLSDKGQYTIAPARVIAIGDVTGTDWSVTISVGSRDGVKPDQLVLNDAGLVGSVSSVTSTSATVRLLVDPDSHVGARLEKTQLLGAVAGGDGPGTLMFTLYDASHQVKVGDRLVTFGSLDYAAGVPIGVVSKVLDSGSGLSRTAEVKPYVDVGTLDLVGVIVTRPRVDPGDSVLPPRPVPPARKTTPAPTPATAPIPPASTAAGQAPVG